MILYLLFFSFIVQAETAIEKYCFQNTQEAYLALKDFSFLKLPTDSIESSGSCLIISIDSKRVELFQKYLLSQFPEANIEFSSINTDLKECQLQVEKKQIIKETKTPIKLSNISSINLHSTEKNDAEFTFIKTHGPFELIHNGTKLEGNCRYLNKNEYEISLKYSNIPIQNNIAIGEKPSFMTQLNLLRGNKVQIFKMEKNSSKNSKDVSLSPRLTHLQDTKNSDTEIFLSIK